MGPEKITKFRMVRDQLDNAITEAINAAAEEGKEICGLLVDNGYFIDLIKVKNKCKKGGSFEFYPKEIRSIQRAIEHLGNEIIGTWHSHPLSLAKPGEGDVKNALDDEIMLIINVMDKNAALWQLNNKQVVQLKFSLLEASNKKPILIYKRKVKRKLPQI